MATIPTIRELTEDIINQIEAELGITIPDFGKSVLRTIALTEAGKLKVYWLAQAQVSKNIFVDTADSEDIGGTLERFGRVFLNRNRFRATQGQYTVTVVGQVGAVIPAETVFKADDSSSSPGKLFQLDAEKTLVSANDTILLRALEGGLDSRLSLGDTLTATSPLLNVDDQVTVVTEDVIPLAEETIEAYRQAILNAIQLEPQGGAATDYRIWAADAQGVQRVYPYTAPAQVSAVDLYIEATQVDSTDGKGTPSAQLIADVEEVVDFDPDETRPLNERGRRPANAVVNYLPVDVKDTVITINGGVNIDPNTETAIENALTQEIDAIRPFVAAADILSNKNDTLDVNVIIAVIQGVLQGNQSFASVDLVVDGNAVAGAITFFDGDIPFLDSVVFN